MLFPRNILSILFFIPLFFPSQAAHAQCDTDVTAPVINIPADMIVSCDLIIDYDLSDPQVRDELFGMATATDECEIIAFSDSLNMDDIFVCNTGIAERSWMAMDESGNISYAIQQIEFLFQQSALLSIPGDAQPGDLPGIFEVLDQGCGYLTVAWYDETSSFDCNGEPDDELRMSICTNFCPGIDLDSIVPVLIPRLDIDNDGVFGDAYEARVTDSGLYLWENGQISDWLAPFSGQYTYEQYNDGAIDPATEILVQGNVFFDANEDCLFDTNETGIPNYGLRIENTTSGAIAYTSSDDMGNFSLDFCQNGDTIIISSNNAFNLSGNCLSVSTIVLEDGMTTVDLDVPVHLPCSQLQVDIGTWVLRRCFNNRHDISYNNLGPLVFEEAYIEVVLDEYMTLTESEIPAIDLGDNTYRFEIGDLEPLQSGGFWIKSDLSCDATLGQTHCVTASIFPENDCEDPNIMNWSGASVALSGSCEGDSIEVILENVGAEDMLQSKNYIIVEDVIMMSINPFQLNSGEFELIKLPANGETWHIAAEQVDFHPGNSQPSVTIEGCGQNNNPGVAMVFPQDDADLGISIDCRKNIGSWDPNDKHVTPRGVGPDHEIQNNVGLEYLIRFQNTGTDTAFTVVIEDEISEALDMSSLRPGASSHDYTFERYDQQNVRFVFNNIMLPDSTVDLEGSQGYVKFNILQKPDNAPGTTIDNKAAIFFDFNEPVITNNAFVTISDHPFGVISYVPELEEKSLLSIFPNPTRQEATLTLDYQTFQNAELFIYNINGQLLLNQKMHSQKTSLQLDTWPKGIYPIEIQIDGKRVERGRLVLQ